MQKDDAQKTLEQQTRMQSRVGKAAARVRGQLVRFPAFQDQSKLIADGRYLFSGLAGAISRAIDRPGVAPTRRPTNADGGETFHFAVTTVSRGSAFTRLAGGDRPGAAAAHEAYIERDGAADHIPNQRRSPEAEENLLLDPITEAWAAPSGQRYIERPGALEPVGETLAICTNIAETFEGRVDFWNAVEESEHGPRSHGLAIDRTEDVEFWRAVDADPNAPRELKNRGRDRLTDDQAIAIREYLKAHAAHGSKAVKITPGRGGRVQTRIILELPYELSINDRFDLLKEFCASQFENIGAEKATLPYCAVIHAPDMHNDPRNSHAHVVFSDRPAEKIAHPQTGLPVWDFLYSESRRDASKHVRLVYPFRRAKVRELQARSWPNDARKKYAELANKKLAERGIAKRLDPRSYKDMGLDITPRPRVSPKEYISEKRGEPTPGGEASIRAQWDRLEADLDRRHHNFRPDPKLDFTFDRQIEKWKPHPVAHMLTSMKQKWRKASIEIKELAADAAAAGIVITKIQSRLDPPLKSKTPLEPDAKAFLDTAIENLVVAPRRRRRELIGWRRTFEKYLNDIVHVRGPVVTNAISVEMHSAVPTVHPHKLAMIDHLADMTNFYTASIRAGREPDLAAIQDAAKAAAQTSPLMPAPKVDPPQPQAAVPSPTPPAPAAAPTPQPAAAPKAPVHTGPPPGAKTPFKSTYGRFLLPSSVILERARQALEAENRVRKDDPWFYPKPDPNAPKEGPRGPVLAFRPRPAYPPIREPAPTPTPAPAPQTRTPAPAPEAAAPQPSPRPTIQRPVAAAPARPSAPAPGPKAADPAPPIRTAAPTVPASAPATTTAAPPPPDRAAQPVRPQQKPPAPAEKEINSRSSRPALGKDAPKAPPQPPPPEEPQAPASTAAPLPPEESEPGGKKRKRKGLSPEERRRRSIIANRNKGRAR